MSDRIVIRTNFFNKGAYVIAGKPYQEMCAFVDIPLANIKNAGRMTKTGDHPVVYFIELEGGEIFHGTRREYGCMNENGCEEFEKQFPKFPYSAHRYKIECVEEKMSLLEQKIDNVMLAIGNMKEMLSKLTEISSPTTAMPTECALPAETVPVDIWEVI